MSDMPGSADEEQVQKRSSAKDFLDFAKDWGGLATLFIALLYTFPSDLISKVINWREQSVISARSALTQLEELTAAKILALENVKSDVWKSDYLSKTFDIRIYNIMVNNSMNFNAAIEQLTTSELVAIGSNYALGASPSEAIPFYEAAINRSRDGDARLFAAASREYGLVLFTPSSIQNIVKARDRYVEAIAIYGNKLNYLGPGLYAIDLAELAGWELQVGDWQCGMNEAKLAMDAFDRMSTVDQQVLATKNTSWGSSRPSISLLINHPMAAHTAFPRPIGLIDRSIPIAYLIDDHRFSTWVTPASTRSALAISGETA